MDQLEELLGDFDAAVSRLQNSSDSSDEFRRALRNVLSELYQLWEYRKAMEDDLLTVAERSQTGCAPLGLIAVRTVSVHYLTEFVPPESRLLFPGPKVFPSEHLFPGENLYWVPYDRMEPRPTRLDPARRGGGRYRDFFAGRLVFEVLAEVRGFLASRPLSGPLEDT